MLDLTDDDYREQEMEAEADLERTIQEELGGLRNQER